MPSPPGPPKGAVTQQRNIKLTVEYDGTAYSGWQSQADQPSVQGALERAAARVVDHPVILHGSGRTDRGVHALGQVANFLTVKSIPLQKLLLGINTYLPDDIRVRGVEEAPLDFHARYSAQGKRYRYTVQRLLPRPAGSETSGGLFYPARVLLRRFITEVPYPLDVEAMRLAARELWGVHDFRAFEGNIKRRPPEPGSPPRSTVRTVHAVLLREEGPFVFIDAFGRGFLYGMVRTIAGTLLEVGRGRRSPAWVKEILLSRDRRRAGFRAPARGLSLAMVYYRQEGLLNAIQAVAEGREPDPSVRDHESILKLFH